MPSTRSSSIPKVWDLLDGDDTVGADLLERLGDHRPISSSAAEIAATLAIAAGSVSTFFDRRLIESTAVIDRRLDALLQDHRVRAGGDVAQAFADHRPREHRRGGGAVTGDVVGLLGDFLDEFGADLLEGVFEVDLLGDRHAVVGDRGCAPLLFEHDVAALGAEGDADCVGELVHARLERTAGVLVVGDLLRHKEKPPEAASMLRGWKGAGLALRNAEC